MLRFITSKIGIIIAASALLFMSALWIKLLHADLASLRVERNMYKDSFGQCETDKKISYEVSNDYQEKLSSLDVQLNDLRGLYNKQCIAVNSASCGHNAATTETKLRVQNGINAEWLIEYSGDAERVRLRLIACQDYLKRISED